MSLIVMLVLMIFVGGMFGFAYTNFKSAEQQRGMLIARVAADTLLYSVGSVISDDFARSPKRIPISDGSPLTASFVDGPISADLRIASSQGEHVFVLDCYARYREWQSGKKTLQIIKKMIGSREVSEWRWR